MLSAPGAFPRPSLRWPRTPFWVGDLLQEFPRTNQDSYFLFKVTDTVLRIDKFSVLVAGYAGECALVDELLVAPVVDGLLADAEIFCDMLYWPALSEQI